MQQSINFYPLLPTPQTQFFTLRRAFIAFAIFMGLFMLNSLWLAIDNWRLQTHLAKLKNDRDMISSQLQQTLQKYPNLSITKNIQNNVQLEKNIALKQKIMSLLNQENNFSSVFERLAESNLTNAWLTQIIITNSGVNITLIGNANTPRAVDDLQNSINRFFKSQPFVIDNLSLDSNDNNFKQYRFILKGIML